MNRRSCVLTILILMNPFSFVINSQDDDAAETKAHQIIQLSIKDSSTKFIHPITFTNSSNETVAELSENEWLNVAETSPPLMTIVIMAIVSLLSPFLSISLLFWLQDLPLTKQCIMNTLYQDIVKLNLTLVSFWIFSGVTSKVLVEVREDSIMPTINEIIAAVNESFFSVIVLCLSLIGGLRLYTTRYHVLDPLTYFFGDNEVKILRSIRSLFLILFLFIISGLLFSSTKPISYFILQGECSMFSTLPFSSRLMLAYEVVLCIICVTLHVSAKIYQDLEDHNLQRDMLELEIQLNRSRRIMIDLEIQWNRSLGIRTDENSLNNTNDRDVTSDYFTSVPYLENLPVIVYMINSIVIGIMNLVNSFGTNGAMSINFWWIITIFTTNQGILMPIAIGFWYPEIRRYFYQNLLESHRCIVDFVHVVNWQLTRRGERRVFPRSEEAETT